MRSNGPFPNQGFITQGDVSTTNFGLFLQDSWTIGRRLTLNLGLRTENEKVPTFVPGDPSVPKYAIEWGFGKKLAPRAGFAWDVQGDGKTKVYGSWGVFYDIFKLQLPLGSFGGDKWLEYYYTLDSGDLSAIVDNPACPPACPGTLQRGPIDFRHVSLGRLRRPRAEADADAGVRGRRRARAGLEPLGERPLRAQVAGPRDRRHGLRGRGAATRSTASRTRARA